LQEARTYVESHRSLAGPWLYTIIYFQGMASLRVGEDENCVMCRGEGACIFPIRSTATHANIEGSSQAVKHYTEYLERFPHDVPVRWLLNLAYMTLGQHPHKVPPRYLMSLDGFGRESDIGRFKDIAPLLGINRFNQAGGAIMDDFDND